MIKRGKLKVGEVDADGYQYVGHCIVSANAVFRDVNDGGLDPDPRGRIGIHQAAVTLSASEYGMKGEDVLMCYACNQERPRYELGVKLAKQKWEKAE